MTSAASATSTASTASATSTALSQCRKTVMTPLSNIGRTRKIKGYFFYENLRPNQQLDVIEYGVLLQNRLKTFIFRGFFLLFAKSDENFYSF
jgi:hypothetical protein